MLTMQTPIAPLGVQEPKRHSHLALRFLPARLLAEQKPAPFFFFSHTAYPGVGIFTVPRCCPVVNDVTGSSLKIQYPNASEACVRRK